MLDEGKVKIDKINVLWFGEWPWGCVVRLMCIVPDMITA